MTATFGSAASRKVVEQLERVGYEAVFVGGAVRDFFLGKRATDIDIATSAKPREVKALFQHTIDIGIEHGTVLVLQDGEPIEVTTYRSSDEHGEKTLHGDLLHRDFTINALALRNDGQVVDLFGGRKDLKNGLIRAAGVAEERIKEDPLRMMRACRFASVLNFEVEQITLEAIQQHAHLLEKVAIERVKVEIDKLLVGQNAYKGLQLIMQSGLNKALPLFPDNFTCVNELFSVKTAKEGWAAIMLLGNFNGATISSAYKLSNQEKKFLVAVQKAFIIRQERPFRRDEFYFFEPIVLYVTEKVFCAMNEQQNAMTMTAFEQEKARLPIQSMQDLKVNGGDLLRWSGRKGGRWVGEWMEKIEYAVLHERCENHPDTMKEWFLSDFDSER